MTIVAAGESEKIVPMRCFFENDQQQTGKHRKGTGISDKRDANALFFALRSGKQPGSAGHSFDRNFF